MIRLSRITAVHLNPANLLQIDLNPDEFVFLVHDGAHRLLSFRFAASRKTRNKDMRELA
jgi:hypothetical protein